MLKSDRATKALSAVRRLSGDWSASFKWIRTKVANVARATFGWERECVNSKMLYVLFMDLEKYKLTRNGAHVQVNEDAAARKAEFLKTFNS